MADVITSDELDELAAYVYNDGPPPKKETIGRIVDRFGELMTDNATLIEKVRQLEIRVKYE